MKRPTLRDIAEIAKVSHVTVSLALRKDPRITMQTRERIEEIARQIGYRPDPALSALMIYRRGAKPSQYKATLAWVSSKNRPEVANEFPFDIYRGVKERCDELGYHLDTFRLADMDMRFDRLSKILNARNIQGVLFAPREHANEHISVKGFEWDKFSAISFGFSLVSPKLDVVISAQFRAARLAVRKLRSLGYRRIGYLANQDFNERTDRNFLGGYQSEMSRFSPADAIPALTPSWEHYATEFKEWYYRYKPDVIIAPSSGDVLSPLPTEEVRHCGLAVLDLPEIPSQYAGICQNYRIVGQMGVDEVIAMIHAGRRGIPSTPKRVLVEGFWLDGPSAPRVVFQ